MERRDVVRLFRRWELRRMVVVGDVGEWNGSSLSSGGIGRAVRQWPGGLGVVNSVLRLMLGKGDLGF